MKTDREIVKEVNELAHLLLQQRGGYVASSPDFKFYRAAMGDVRSTYAWREAVQAYELITKSEVADALEFVLEHGEEEPPKDSALVAGLKDMIANNPRISEADRTFIGLALLRVQELERIQWEAAAYDRENITDPEKVADGDDYDALCGIIGLNG